MIRIYMYTCIYIYITLCPSLKNGSTINNIDRNSSHEGLLEGMGPSLAWGVGCRAPGTFLGYRAPWKHGSGEKPLVRLASSAKAPL